MNKLLGLFPYPKHVEYWMTSDGQSWKSEKEAEDHERWLTKYNSECHAISASAKTQEEIYREMLEAENTEYTFGHNVPKSSLYGEGIESILVE